MKSKKKKKKSSGSAVGALFPHGLDENCVYGMDAYGNISLLSDDVFGYSSEEGGLDVTDCVYEEAPSNAQRAFLRGGNFHGHYHAKQTARRGHAPVGSGWN